MKKTKFVRPELESWFYFAVYAQHMKSYDFLFESLNEHTCTQNEYQATIKTKE
jgi:hypothetical protein